MKAYKCDVCGSYNEGQADGVLYDNRGDGKGERYDLCPTCVERALQELLAEESDE